LNYVFYFFGTIYILKDLGLTNNIWIWSGIIVFNIVCFLYERGKIETKHEQKKIALREVGK